LDRSSPAGDAEIGRTAVPENASVSARAVVDAIRENGVTHIVWLPDSETRFMYDAMRAEEAFSLIPVCREGETIAIAAGLWLGGKKPVALIQNTGLFESGDSIRGLALELDMPLVLLIGYRGWTRHGVVVDSPARYTEPILHAWGIPYYLVEKDSDVERLSIAFRQAAEDSRPVAVLFGHEFRA